MDSNSTHSSDYDTDLEDDFIGDTTINPSPTQEVPKEVSLYLESCDKLCLIPSTKVIHCLKHQQAVLSVRHFGPERIKAIAQVLKICTFITELDFEENGLGPGGSVCVFNRLQDNEGVKKLNLARNKLSSCDVETIQDFMFLNTELRQLSLAGNNFRDSDIELLACGLEMNSSLESLDLSGVGVTETGGQILGRVLSYNDTLVSLDLSWNMIRRKGAVAICKGIKRNHSLKEVNLAFNGFGYEGALAVRELLKTNTFLESLDISNNRIDWKAGRLVAAGLKQNRNLQELKIGHNPLTSTVCVDLLEAAQLSRLTSLSVEGVSVTQRALYLAENLKSSRCFTFFHGTLVGSADLFGERKVARADPEKLFVEYMAERNLRPLDIFRRFDKVNHLYISREQFIQGLKTAKVPLEKYEIEKLLKTLDGANAGKITYYRLMELVRAQVKASREEQRRKQKQNAVISVAHKRIIAQGDTLPPIVQSNRVSSRRSTEDPSQLRPLISADYSRNSRVTPSSSEPKIGLMKSKSVFIMKSSDILSTTVALSKVSRHLSLLDKK